MPRDRSICLQVNRVTLTLCLSSEVSNINCAASFLCNRFPETLTSHLEPLALKPSPELEALKHLPSGVTILRVLDLHELELSSVLTGGSEDLVAQFEIKAETSCKRLSTSTTVERSQYSPLLIQDQLPEI